jgi:hypothetical protein
MTRLVSSELYEAYKQTILEMSPAIQVYRGTTMIRDESCLSDQEIADRLGLPVEVVTEIRCIAEIDLAPLEDWMQSDRWRRQRPGSERPHPDTEPGAR